MSRSVEEELEHYRAYFCTNCPWGEKECRNCVESNFKPTKLKVLKKALEMGIPEEYARGIVVGGSNVCLN